MPQVPVLEKDVKSIAVLGSTGTIGRLTLEVINRRQEEFKVFGLAANRNIELVSAQVEEFSPREVVVLNEEQCALISGLEGTNVECGAERLVELARNPDVDIVVVAMTGTATLDAVLGALDAGKRVALASKEILVSFGVHVMKALREGNGELLPVDSEHNALFQCLEGRDMSSVKKLVLTASGGPFRERDYRGASPQDVLDHPVWQMGERITVDSATLMNKGFEVIEAHHLFEIEPERIQVLVHPQSIVHSLVEFQDGSVLAQLAVPDMRLPIAYALSYPERTKDVIPSLDLTQVSRLEFQEPDYERCPCLGLAFDALRRGGTAPAALQAADQEAVEQFLHGNLSFERIPDVVRNALDAHDHIASPGISEIREVESQARNFVSKECNGHSS